MKFTIEPVVIALHVTCYDLKIGGRFLERYDRKSDARTGQAAYARLLDQHREPAYKSYNEEVTA